MNLSWREATCCKSDKMLDCNVTIVDSLELLCAVVSSMSLSSPPVLDCLKNCLFSGCYLSSLTYPYFISPTVGLTSQGDNCESCDWTCLMLNAVVFFLLTNCSQTEPWMLLDALISDLLLECIHVLTFKWIVGRCELSNWAACCYALLWNFS